MLKEKIQEDLNSALKEKKELKVSVLRLLSAAIFNKEKEKRYKLSKEKPEFTGKELEKESRLTDDEVIEVVTSEIKKRKEAILEFSAYAKGYGGCTEARGEGGEKGKIEKFIDKEKAELAILQKYLPEQLSEEEIKKLAKEVIEKLRATELKDIGKVMAELMPKVKGKAEGSLVNKIVKELLTSKNE